MKDIIDYIRERIESDKCIDMQKLWERGFQRFSDEIFLTWEDKKILLDFSKNLGCGDRESEKNNIKIIEELTNYVVEVCYIQRYHQSKS